VPGTLVRAPWLGSTFAQVLLSVYELDGSPCVYDPRHVLRRVIDRFKEFDLTPVIACELEFFLVDRERGPNGELRIPASPVTGNRSWDIQVYGLLELEDYARIKGLRLQHGVEATFMAKPFSDVAGSGQHLHVSLADKDGKNAFASEKPEGSELLKFAVGGMQALLEDSMAVFAPNANSYRRFRPNTYAPGA